MPRLLSPALRARTRRRRIGLSLEPLERRELMTAYVWATDSDGNWDDPLNWSPQQVPGGGDDVTIDRGAFNPQILVRDARSVRSLTARESLVIAPGASLQTNAASDTDSTLVVGGTLRADGAPFTILATSELSWQGGVLAGGAPFVNQGVITISSLADVELQGQLQNQSEIRHVGSGSLRVSGTLTNTASGLYEFQSDASILGSGTLTQSGFIRKSAGGGISRIAALPGNDFNLHQLGGLIEARSGRLQLDSLRGDSTGANWIASAGATVELIANPFAVYRGTYAGSGAGTVEFSGGVFQTSDPGGATFNFPDGLFRWTGGAFVGSTNRPVTNIGFMTLDGPNDKTFANTFRNQGTLRQQGTGVAVVTGSLANEAGSVYDLQSDASILGSGTLTQAGVLRKSAGGGISRIAALPGNDFNVHQLGGTIEAQSGRLQLDSLRGDSTGATWNAAAGAVLELIAQPFGFASYRGTYTGAGAGTVEFSSGVFQTADPGGATFNFPDGLFRWTGGAFVGSTNRPVTNIGFMTLDGANDKTFANTFRNQGTLRQQGTGAAVVTGSLANEAGAVYDLQSDASILGSGTLTQSGVIRKSAGVGISRIAALPGNDFNVHQLGGTIEAQSGRLQLDSLRGDSTGATWNASAGAVLELIAQPFGFASYRGTYSGTGAGTVEFSSGVFQTSDPGGATFNFPDGLFRWTGGAFVGSTNRPVTNIGFMKLDGANDKTFAGTFRNQGTLAQQGSGAAVVTGSLANEAGAIYELRSDASLLGSGTLNQSGEIRKSAGGGTSRIGALVGSDFNLNQLGGTITAQSGRIKLDALRGDSTGATWNASAGAVVELVAQPDGFVTYRGVYGGSGAGRVEFTGGAFQTAAPGATLDFPADYFHWIGGAFLGDGNRPVTNAGHLSIDGAGVKSLPGYLVNTGTLELDGPGTFAASGTLDNRTGALFDLTGDVTLLGRDQFGNRGHLVNTGTIRKSDGTGVALVDTQIEGTLGTVEVLEGRLKFGAGGSTIGGVWNVAAGAFLELGRGTTSGELYSVKGDYSGTGPGSVELAASLNGYDGAQPMRLHFPAGGFRLVSGELLGTIINDDHVEFAVPSSLFARATLINNGVWTHVGAGDFVLNANSRITNTGLFDLRSDGDFIVPGDASLGAMRFINEGTLRKSNGLGVSDFRHDGSSKELRFENSGLVEVRAGTLRFQDSIAQVSGASLTGGTWIVGESSTLNFSSRGNLTTLGAAASVTLDGPNSTFVNLATLANNQGEFHLAGGRDFTTTAGFTNTGHLVVGPASILTVNGPLVENGVNTLGVEIAGRPRTANYGRIVAAGQATLNGRLDVAVVDGFGPTPLDAYPIVTFASRVGSFSSITGLNPYFTAGFSTTAVTLNVRPDVPTYDLAPTSVTVPPTARPGQPVSISYVVANQSAQGVGGTWFDSLYLSRDASYGADDLLLGRVEHGTGVGGNQSYGETLLATLPPVADGAYHVIVLADSRGLVPDPDRDDNFLTSVGTIAVASAPLTLGVTTAGTLAAGQDLYYRLDVPPGGDLRLLAEFPVQNGGELYLRYREPPTTSTFDLVAANPLELERLLAVPAAQAGTYYVLLRGREGAGTGMSFDLRADMIGLSVDELSVARGGNTGRVTTTLTGAGFTPTSSVALVSSLGAVVRTAVVRYSDSRQLFATFDLTGVTPGVYGVRATDGAATDTLPASFTVTAGVGGHVDLSLTSPRVIRSGATSSLTVEYVNTGDADVPAPAIMISSDNARFRLDDGGQFVDDRIELLGINRDGPAGILPPGARGTIQLTWQPKTTGGHVFSQFAARLINEQESIDWLALKDDLRPYGQAADAWDAIYANFMASVGDTMGEYYDVLRDNATYLSQFGVLSVDPVRYFQFEMQQAGGFGAINRRYAVGAYGRGQVDPYNVFADTDSNGHVVIHAAGRLRTFLKQTDGSYARQPGDEGVLELFSGGGYRLTELDGGLSVYRADGWLDYVEDANGNRVTTNYAGGRVSGFTLANGDVVQFTYDGNGQIVQETDAVGRTTTYAYDAAQRLVTMTTPRGTTRYTYVTGAGLAREHALASIEYVDGTHGFFTYDARGRVVQQTRDGGTQLTTFSYDSVDNMTVVSPTGGVHKVLGGEAGQVLAVEDASGRRTASKFNADGQLTQVAESNVRQSVAYDQAGNPNQWFDALGGLMEIEYEPGTSRPIMFRDARGNRTLYTYDTDGNVIAITDEAGNARNYGYDARGRRTQTITATGRSVTLTLDAAGLTVRQDASDGSQVFYAYDAHRNLISVTDARGAVTFTYDAADRMTSVTYPDGRRLDYAFDAVGRRTQLKSQDGFEENYEYNSAGRLRRVSDAAHATLVLYTYDSAGRVSRTTYGNGATIDYGYDVAGQLTSLAHRAPDTTLLASFVYGYDAFGRRTSVTTLDGLTTYAYDAAGRLTSATLPGGRTISYEYDAVGNRVRTVDNGLPVSYGANVLNQYTTVGGATFTYDADGNLTSRTDGSGTTTYAYDVRGRVVGMTKPGEIWTYEYDALGHRSAVVRNGVRTELLVDPTGLGALVAEYDDQGDLTANYVRGLSLAGRVDAAGDASFYHFDAIGNTAALTDQTGAISDTYRYLPFGEKLATTGSTVQPFTFGGELGVRDEGDGVYFMRLRSYDPQTGRFTQRDPIGFLGGAPNVYTYAQNDPVSGADPSGLEFAFNGLSGRGLDVFVDGLKIVASKSTNAAERLSAQLTLKQIESGLAKYEAEAAAKAEAELAANSKVYGEKGATLTEEVAAETTAETAADVAVETAADTTATVVEEKAAPTVIESVVAKQTAKTVVRSTATRTVATLGLRAIAPATTVVIGVDIGFAINRKYNSENPDGTPIDVQEVLTPKYNDTVRDPCVQRLIKDHTRLNGTPPNNEQVATYIKVCADVVRLTQTEQITSADPNDIVNPAGVGAQAWVRPDETLPYKILFENKPNAGAPAQTVVVTQKLDADLDWNTFHLTSFGFSSFSQSIPAGLDSYHTVVSLPASGPIGGDPLNVDFSAKLDRATGTVTWTLTALDPTTGDLPANPLAGFLPPNTTSPIGEGFVAYTVRSKSGLTTGTRLDAQASIVFDTNEAIATPQRFNVIDAAGPTSAVTALPAGTYTNGLTITWSGADDVGGSGIAAYDVYLSTDSGPFELWQEATTATSRVFDRPRGHTYAFYSVATDATGYRELAPATPDATTFYLGPPWHNDVLRLDVDQDTLVAPIDALLVINELNVPTIIAGNGALPLPPPTMALQTPRFDVNGDNFVAPIDALLVINFLNLQAGPEGEGTSENSPGGAATDALSLATSSFVASPAMFDGAAGRASPAAALDRCLTTVVDESRDRWTWNVVTSDVATARLPSGERTASATDATNIADDELWSDLNWLDD